ncbi:9917_t:CDS:1, partial [Rhizophagus irregularis]
MSSKNYEPRTGGVPYVQKLNYATTTKKLRESQQNYDLIVKRRKMVLAYFQVNRTEEIANT